MIRKARIIPRCSSTVRPHVTSGAAASAAAAIRRESIPKALRSAVWVKYIGNKFDSKCYVDWCMTTINPFSFEVGHNIPQSKGGKTTIENLRPICSQCNKSMGNRYSIIEFSDAFKEETNEQPRLKRVRRVISTCICQ